MNRRLKFGLNPFAGIAAAAVIAGLVSVPVSALLPRLTGGYFAVASLGYRVRD